MSMQTQRNEIVSAVMEGMPAESGDNDSQDERHEHIQQFLGDFHGDEASTTKTAKKDVKQCEPVKIPLPEQFNRHAKWKPKPYAEGENFFTIWCELRAQAAEWVTSEVEKVLEEHVPAGLWPNGRLETTYRAAANLRKAATLAKSAEKERARASKANAADRADEKKKQLDALKNAMSLALTSQLTLESNLEKTMEDRITLGRNESLKVFKSWAPKINSWKLTTRKKAIDVAKAMGFDETIAESALNDAIKEAEMVDTSGLESPSVRKRDADASPLPAPPAPKKQKKAKNLSGEGRA